MYRYKVRAYKQEIKGCGASVTGWDSKRCEDFEEFLNSFANQGWEFYQSEYRAVKTQGCGGQDGLQLICVFRKEVVA